MQFSVYLSRIFSLLPPPRDGTITSRLRSTAIYPRPVTRTKRFTSSVHYCLLSDCLPLSVDNALLQCVPGFVLALACF